MSSLLTFLTVFCPKGSHVAYFHPSCKSLSSRSYSWLLFLDLARLCATDDSWVCLCSTCKASACPALKRMVFLLVCILWITLWSLMGGWQETSMFDKLLLALLWLPWDQPRSVDQIRANRSSGSEWIRNYSLLFLIFTNEFSVVNHICQHVWWRWVCSLNKFLIIPLAL